MSRMKLPPELEKSLKELSPPSATVKAFGATVPGAKLRLLVRGNVVSEGNKVAKPAGALIVSSTVALPARALALAGTEMPFDEKVPRKVDVCPGVTGAFGLLIAVAPERVSRRRTGAASGWKKRPPVAGGA